MKKLLISVLLCLGLVHAHAQQVDPTYQINWGTAGYPVVPNPTANQAIDQPAGTSLGINALNGTFVAGQAPYGTIQAAINAAVASCSATASACGAVVIPPGYAGTDSWTTNANGVLVYDERPLNQGTSVSAVQIVNAALFGATCTGNDDTAAINAALASQWIYNFPLHVKKNITVQLPQGSCLITAPIELGEYGSLIGQDDATELTCYYPFWHGTDYNCLEMVADGQINFGAANGMRTIGHFNLTGYSPSTPVLSNGIFINNTANVYDSTNYSFHGVSISHMRIANFDTGISAKDLSESTLDFDSIGETRIGVNLNGDDQLVNFDHVNIFNGTWANTPSADQTASTGLVIQASTAYLPRRTTRRGFMFIRATSWHMIPTFMTVSALAASLNTTPLMRLLEVLKVLDTPSSLEPSDPVRVFG